MLGQYCSPTTSSSNDTSNSTSATYWEPQQEPQLSTRVMDERHHQGRLGSSPPRAPSSPSRHPAKLSIRSLINPASPSKDDVGADPPPSSRSPRQDARWNGEEDDADAEGGQSMGPVAATGGHTPAKAHSTPMDMEDVTGADTRPSPSLTVRLTLEEPSPEPEPASVARSQRRRSFTSQELNGDRGQRKSPSRSRRDSPSALVRGGKEALLAPVVPPQRIRLRSPKKRSPSPRREGMGNSPRAGQKRPARDGRAKDKSVDARSSRSPSQKRHQRASTGGRERLRSHSPRRASAGTVPSASPQGSPVKGIRSEPTRSPPKRASPSRATTNTAETAATNKIRIRLRPSLEASSTESTAGAEETVACKHRHEQGDGVTAKKQRTLKGSRTLKRSSAKDKGESGDSISRNPSRRARLSRTSDELSPRRTAKRAGGSPEKSPSKQRDPGDPGAVSSPGKRRGNRADDPSLSQLPPTTLAEASSHAKRHSSQTAPPSSPRSLVNNEFCSACAGAGTLICCEACPRSFHFLCVDPPIDPDNVPDENWFCDECRRARIESSQESILQEGNKPIASAPKELWTRLRDYVTRLNPKTFTLPKRVRKMVGDGEAARALIVEPDDDSPRAPGVGPNDADASALSRPLQPYHSHKERLSGKGYCHHCGRGATMEENKLLINCDDCTLKWHLDCLPYPLAVYPSGHRHWACPVHLTRHNLAHLPPGTVQQILDRSRDTNIKITDWPERPLPRTDLSILPESAVRLHFGWSTVESLNGSSQLGRRYEGCEVPGAVKQAYRQMRITSTHEAKLLRYYETYDYTDRAMETNMAI